MYRIFSFTCLFCISLFLAACDLQTAGWSLHSATQAPLFIPPTLNSGKTSTVSPTKNSNLTPTAAGTAATLALTATQACTNSLTYLSDLSLPDKTQVDPNSSLDKRWQVKNSGTCDWDSSYTLKKIGGDPLGITTDQVLYPARAGSEAAIELIFTAPATPGTYSSVWQAYSPDGTAFGDSIYIEIIVK